MDVLSIIEQLTGIDYEVLDASIQVNENTSVFNGQEFNNTIDGIIELINHISRYE